MKQIRLRTVLPAMLGVVLLVGCGESHDPIAGGVDQGATPAVQQPSDSRSATGNRVLWGLWKISISADRETITVLPDRVGALHFNVVRLIEVAPCSDCLRIKNVKGTADGLSADVILIHPFPALLQYTGFDVRGIFISGARYTFPVSGRKIAWGDDVARMLNPDGYTHLFNPTNFPYTNPPILGYIPGHKAPGGDLSATLNPYVAYEQDKPRCVFMPGTVSTRTVFLYLPPGPLEFGYAVDASWFPAGVEVTDPVNDFPPQANCMEAYRISMEVGTEMQHGYGSAPIAVEVYDHQGLVTIESVKVEAPDLFSGEAELAYTQTTPAGGFVFEGAISNTRGGRGVYPVLVRVRDTVTDGNLGRVDAFQIDSVLVKLGWARTWGEAASGDHCGGVAVDSSGGVYATGRVSGGIDLRKFDSSGVCVWERTWGYGLVNKGYAVAVDGLGDVYVTGEFLGSVDFDPGPGTDQHSSAGDNEFEDIFLSKFDATGDWQWTRTWGGVAEDTGVAVAADNSGNAYVTGLFSSTVDFDPGPGTVEHTSGWKCDVFLSKFDSSGDFQWAVTWGGDLEDGGGGIAVEGSEYIYVTGDFQGTVDFDPGIGEDYHTSNGSSDSFLSKFDSSGGFQWARTWGSTSSYDRGSSVAVDDSGSVLVTGRFGGDVDFDPGPDEDRHGSGSDWSSDAFLCKFDSLGNYYWARTWGSQGANDVGNAVSSDGWGNAYVAGYFKGTCDFDPGDETDERTSFGEMDGFLSKFDPSGEFEWARTLGNQSFDVCGDVACDTSGNSYTAGYFTLVVDFDPGPAVDDRWSNGFSDAFLWKIAPDGYW